MSKTQEIMQVIENAHYMGENGLRDYHVAQAVKSALCKPNFVERFYAVKSALHAYRVSVTIGDNQSIRIYRHDTSQELIFS